MNSRELRNLDISGLPVTHEAVIPEDYLDEMGHMNVMWYTHLFSCATGGMFKLYGMTLEYFKTYQHGSFALEAHIRYLAEIHAGKRVTVRSRAVARSEKRSHFMHFIYNEDDKVVSTTSEFINTHVDMRLRKPSPFPPEIAAAYDRLIEEHNQLDWDPPLCGAMQP